MSSFSSEDKVAQYEVGLILARCHLQKALRFGNGVEAVPLGPTGFVGGIHEAGALFAKVGFDFTREDLHRTISHFRDIGHATLLKLPTVRASSFQAAIESGEAFASSTIDSLAVVSANPVLRLCAFAKASADSGVKFYFPADRVVFHGTNIAGYLDAAQDIEQRARSDEKFALLLRMYRASLRELETDHQLLFQLILFEEASDNESGSLAERLRKFADKYGFAGDISAIATECGLALPNGKDMVDVIVKLRNAAAHNGKIDADSLRTQNGDWVAPLLSDKNKLHRAVTEALRYMFCALVGHTRDFKATLVTGRIEIQFD